MNKARVAEAVRGSPPFQGDTGVAEAIPIQVDECCAALRGLHSELQGIDVVLLYRASGKQRWGYAKSHRFAIERRRGAGA